MQEETQDGQEVLTADTPEIYAQKIQQLHEDNALWERLQKCGREYIQRKYNAGNLRERLAEILNRESVLPEVLSSR